MIGEYIAGMYNYWISIALMMTGFYAVVSTGNLVKKIMGIGIFQTSVLLFYVSIAVREGGAPPILEEGVEAYMNPLPHVLMLTAIVVGVATLAVGLALIVRIKEAYGSVEEDDILSADVEESQEKMASKPTPPKRKKKRTPVKPKGKAT